MSIRPRQIIGIIISIVVAILSGTVILITGLESTNPANVIMYLSQKVVFYSFAIIGLSYAIYSYRKKGLSR